MRHLRTAVAAAIGVWVIASFAEAQTPTLTIQNVSVIEGDLALAHLGFAIHGCIDTMELECRSGWTTRWDRSVAKDLDPVRTVGCRFAD